MNVEELENKIEQIRKIVKKECVDCVFKWCEKPKGSCFANDVLKIIESEE